MLCTFWHNRHLNHGSTRTPRTVKVRVKPRRRTLSLLSSHDLHILFACGVNKGTDILSDDTAQADDTASNQDSGTDSDTDDGINPLSSGCGIESTVQSGGFK